MENASSLDEAWKKRKGTNPAVEPPLPISTSSSLSSPHNEPSSAVGQRPNGPGGIELARRKK